MKGLMQELVFMTVLMAVNIVPVFILLIISVKFFCFINEKLISKWCAGNYLVPTVVIAMSINALQFFRSLQIIRSRLQITMHQMHSNHQNK